MQYLVNLKKKLRVISMNGEKPITKQDMCVMHIVLDMK